MCQCKYPLVFKHRNYSLSYTALVRICIDFFNLLYSLKIQVSEQMRHLIVFYLKGGSPTLGTVEMLGQTLLWECFPVLCRVFTSTLPLHSVDGVTYGTHWYSVSTGFPNYILVDETSLPHMWEYYFRRQEMATFPALSDFSSWAVVLYVVDFLFFLFVLWGRVLLCSLD